MNIYAKSICKERVKMLKQCFDNVREKHPLVHNITNYVTVNDVANILLACGGSPIMADDSGEVEDITSICQGLNINIGTLNKNTIPFMFLAGKKANVLGHVVLLDPVGAGASGLRTKTANELVRDIKFTVIRGNISEIRTLMEGTGNTKGVDADLADAVTEENLDETIELLDDARNILVENGCAHRNDEDGHNKDAQTLKDEIDAFEEQLKQSVQDQKSSGGSDDKDQQNDNDTPDDSDGEKGSSSASEEEKIKEKLQEIQGDSLKQRNSEMDTYETYKDGYNYYNGRTW